jgi:hypothetical protein
MTMETPSDDKTRVLYGLIDLGLRLLALRILTVLAMLLDSGLFAWAMAKESPVCVVAATLFAITSWFLIQPGKEKST